MKQIRLISGFFTVGVWTLVSRVLGFVRDVLIAGALGTGPVAEAFVMAFSLPNLFRRFFAEGAFNMAFVPLFSKKVEAGEDAKGFAQDAFSALATVLIILNGIAMIAMPFLVLAMASGFWGDTRFDLAVIYGRITFPYILFISLVALLSGVLNSIGRFQAAAAAPVLLNVLFIAALQLATYQNWDLGLTLAWTVPVAGLAQLTLGWVAAKRAGFLITPRWPRLTRELKRLAIIAAPAALAGGVVQINLLIGRQVASVFEGAYAWLYYADRLYQLPLGVVGIAIGIVLLPELSRRLRSEDTAGGALAFNRAFEASLALTLPATVALVAIPLPLISVLFERGEFSATDTYHTAIATAIYGFGLPAFVLQKVYQPLFFAREDTKSPFYYAIFALVVNAVIAIGLMNTVGYLAAAIGTTVASWAMLAGLWWGARKFGVASQIETAVFWRVAKMFFCSLVMGACLYWLGDVMAPYLAMAGIRYFALGVLIVVGVGIYFALAHLTGAMPLRDITGMLRR